MKEVYIGNGETITVNPDENNRKEYNWEQLQKYLDDGIEVTAGMEEDWFFTAETVTQKCIDNKRIAGIGSSHWATPAVRIGDSDEFIDCYRPYQHEAQITTKES